MRRGHGKCLSLQPYCEVVKHVPDLTSHLTSSRSLASLPLLLAQMKTDRQRLSVWLVTSLCLLSGAVLLLDILMEERGARVADSAHEELLEQVAPLINPG